MGLFSSVHVTDNGISATLGCLRLGDLTGAAILLPKGVPDSRNEQIEWESSGGYHPPACSGGLRMAGGSPSTRAGNRACAKPFASGRMRSRAFT